jgi:hypothetical protein
VFFDFLSWEIIVFNFEIMFAALSALPQDCKGAVSKGSVPDYVRFGAIPTNFKGTIDMKALKSECESWAHDHGLTVL